jgi:hypothetical protein
MKIRDLVILVAETKNNSELGLLVYDLLYPYFSSNTELNRILKNVLTRSSSENFKRLRRETLSSLNTLGLDLEISPSKYVTPFFKADTCCNLSFYYTCHSKTLSHIHLT